MNSVNLTATGSDHAAASIYPLLHHYPTRYAEEPNPFMVQTLKGETKLVYLFVPRDLIETGDIEPISSALQDMVSTREKAAAFRQRVGIMVDGYDQDPRELWQVAESRNFCRRLFTECPFVMLLAHPDGGLLKLLAACWIHEDASKEDVKRKRMSEFLTLGFRGLNQITHRLAISEEVNREICDAASKALLVGPQA
jgi:hypothetical protein